MVAVLVVCLAGLAAVGMQVRCVDAAREAARLSARGDDRAARQTAQQVGPAGATVHLGHEESFVVATVTAKSALLPGVSISARAVAAAEPPDR